MRWLIWQILADLEPDNDAGNGQIHKFPTCYDPCAGPELSKVASYAGLSVSDVI
ncbi:MAG: carboxyltransferase domain-containing protein [Marinobacter psychrophilus]|jgi:allophanate hydrolase subunit 1|nr:carboxyltransferase domain-containing protein [Marinobacter psychrophilus]MBQ0845443.1 carboxyltransferase domain-containing protein [Marinobacter psychrophilus]